MKSGWFLVSFLLLGAGCLNASQGNPLPSTSTAARPGIHLGTDLLAKFSAPIIIDEGRAGGEPVIAVTPTGTIVVAAHPGYTHVHPSGGLGGPEAVVPTSGQSYLWRSTDRGATFKLVSLLPVNAPNGGPRGVGQGVSDPDFTVDGKGRIYLTDLESLADASVSWSDDDGATWLMGNDDAAGGVVDRNWLASFGTTVYFRGDGLNDVRKSDDRGATFTNAGSQGCTGDLVANPLNGHILIGCDGGFDLSTDGGQTWAEKKANATGSGPIVSEPAIDAAGTVYRAFDPGRTKIVLAATKDEGATWTQVDLTPFFPELAQGTVLWPWTSAGSGGRVSVSFYGSATPKATTAPDGDWFVYNAIVIGADTDAPAVYASKVTPKATHHGPMCQGGTACQATTAINAGSDRRLGDFFESTIDHEGFVHIVYTDTQVKPGDVVGHVGYARLTDGPRLIDGAVPAGFPTQG